MAPARNAKKRRVAASANKEAPPTATAASAKELLLQSDEATSNLSSLLDDMESMAAAGESSQLQNLLTDASLSLLTLKSTQRSLCLGVESHLLHDVVASRRAEVGSKTLELQNLVYERNHLRGRVQECRDFHGGQLAKMARDETSGGGEEDAAAAAAAAVDAAATTTSHVDREKEDEQIINAFLAGGVADHGNKSTKKTKKAAKASSFDHRDPSNHAATLSHLKAELTLRRTKEAELTKARSELEQLRKQCASRKAFLATLPRKLREVERSTGPLQSFFREAVGVVSSSSDTAGGSSTKNKSKNKDDVQPTLLIGTDRSARIEAARTLPEPLYTVFWQLTGYVDAFGVRDSGGDTSPAKMLKVDVLEENSNAAASEDGTNSPEGWIVRHPKAVALTIPAPDVKGLSSSSSGGPVTIKFRYLPRLGLVTAATTASSTNGDGRALLAGLFPNDDGTTLPSCAAPFLLGDDAAEMLSQVEEALRKRGDLPYGWCQYVAGIIFPPQSDAGDGAKEDEGFDDDDEDAGGHYHDDTDGEARYSHHYHHHHESYSTDQAPTKRGTIEPSTRSVVRSLNRRIRARATLGALLNTLGRSKAPPVHSALDDKRSSGASTTSRLTSWKECTGTDKSCKYFSVSIKRGSDGSSVQATVKIDPAYPAIPPLWSLQDATTTEDAYDPTMGAIEEGINADLSSLVVDGVEETYDWILSAQVARLLECLDRPSENGGAKKSAVSYDLYSKGL